MALGRLDFKKFFEDGGFTGHNMKLGTVEILSQKDCVQLAFYIRLGALRYQEFKLCYLCADA